MRDDVLVRVRAGGVCHTDVHIAAGRWPQIRLPLVLGHEIAGEVAGVGPLLVYASWGCGECELCLAGEEQLCPSGSEAGWVEDGGYAELVRVPSKRYLFPLAGIHRFRLLRSPMPALLPIAPSDVSLTSLAIARAQL
jgi:alcohol dehydrogenase, propanol-preferring